MLPNLYELPVAMFPELDLFYTDPAQHSITAGDDLDDLLDHELSDLSVVCVKSPLHLHSHFWKLITLVRSTWNRSGISFWGF